MKVAVLGGTGHIGTYLVPRLLEASHRVVSFSRGRSVPYRKAAAWVNVEQLQVDRAEAERSGSFGQLVQACRPDAVIDLTCFTVDSARGLLAAIDGPDLHYVHIGSVWVYGPREGPPHTETSPRKPYGAYACAKAAAESEVLSSRWHSRTTVLHPGQIIGPLWWPINPAGNPDPAMFFRLASQLPVAFPPAMATTFQFSHADDIARLICKVLSGPRSTFDREVFNVGCEQEIGMLAYAEHVCRTVGVSLRLEETSQSSWLRGTSSSDREYSGYYSAYKTAFDTSKARAFGFSPAYSCEEAIREFVLSKLS